MASRGPRPGPEAARGAPAAGCSGRSAPGAPPREAPGAGGTGAPPPGGAEGPGGRPRRSVLGERERRRRIAASCEHLRALLPGFDGRREDAASVLEMAVRFLQLAGARGPGAEPQPAPPPPEPRRPWRTDAPPPARAALSPSGPRGRGPGPAAATTPQGPLSCVGAGVDQDGALLGTDEELDGPAAARGAPSPVPWPPARSPPGLLRAPPSWPPLGSEAAGSCQARLLPDSRCGLGAGVDDKMSLLLAASPDWWPGAPPARSSLLDRAEPSFPVDPAPLEPSGSDVGCPGLALGDEADGIFPNFLTY